MLPRAVTNSGNSTVRDPDALAFAWRVDCIFLCFFRLSIISHSQQNFVARASNEKWVVNEVGL